MKKPIKKTAKPKPTKPQAKMAKTKPKAKLPTLGGGLMGLGATGSQGMMP
jgi:hypothetical protein